MTDELNARTIVVEGILTTDDSEGGFGPDWINIDGQNMSKIIASLYNAQLDCRGSLGEHMRFGRVRLTIERLEDGE